MRKSALSSLIAISLIGIASSAFALNSRSAVSVNGSDSNPCTPALPCRSFSVAMTSTTAGGEIIALDSGGYGPFTVSQAVTVAGAAGVYAAISAPSGTAISVGTGGTTNVTIRNLVILGLGTGDTAVDSASGSGPLHILGCTIRGFAVQAISTKGLMTFVDHTVVQDCIGAVGIDIEGTSAQTPARTYITNSRFAYNGTAVLAESYSIVDVEASSFAENDNAIQARATAVTSVADVTIAHCTIAGSSSIGILATSDLSLGAQSVRLSGNVISYNSTGLTIGPGATVSSYVNNTFAGNGVDVAGGTLSTAALQ